MFECSWDKPGDMPCNVQYVRFGVTWWLEYELQVFKALPGNCFTFESKGGYKGMGKSECVSYF